MKKIYLCGHTGSENRGCEAIVASTVEVLKKSGISDIALYSFNIEVDKRMGLDKKIEIIPYPKKSFLKRAYLYIKKKVLKDKTSCFKYLYKNFPKKEAIFFNIGGDTYCYSTPYISYSLNQYASKNDVTNVFWGCSVDEKALNNSRMKKDLNQYSHIFVREVLSEKILCECVTDKNKIHKVCDPAFHLEMTKTELPKGFVEGNTLGLNISHMIMENVDDDNNMIYKNVYSLIDYILNETTMNVCLIPHVYNAEKNTQDIRVLRKIYKSYEDNERVSIVDKELSCTELKYIISKCRFFIGARTHSTIAAYSTSVPCIALSYSIKSRGIATDLFGTDVGYAIPYKGIKNEDELKNAFISVLLNNEEDILKQYNEVLPQYKQSIIDATKEIITKL